MDIIFRTASLAIPSSTMWSLIFFGSQNPYTPPKDILHYCHQFFSPDILISNLFYNNFPKLFVHQDFSFLILKSNTRDILSDTSTESALSLRNLFSESGFVRVEVQNVSHTFSTDFLSIGTFQTWFKFAHTIHCIFV